MLDASWHVGASAGQYASDGSAVDPANDNYDPTALSTRRASSYGLQSRAAGPRARGRGARTASAPRSSRTTSTSRRTCSGAARRSCSAAQEHRHRPEQPDDGGEPQPLLAVLLLDLVGRLGVPGRLRHPLLLLLRRAHGRAWWRRRPQSSSRSGSARRSASSTRPTATRSAPRSPTTARRPATRGRHRPRHDRRPLRRHLERRPKPLANLVNFGLHPEFLEGNDLISADYVGPLEGMTDEATGAVNDLDPERRRHLRARAQHLPLDPRAAGVHPQGLRPGRVRRAADGATRSSRPGGRGARHGHRTRRRPRALGARSRTTSPTAR